MGRQWVLVGMPVLIALVLNAYFVLTPLLGDLPKISGKANSHFLLYSQSVAGYAMTGSLVNDYCYAEHSDDLRPRFHISFLLYGWLLKLLGDPFWTHAIGNVIIVTCSLLAGVLVSRKLLGRTVPGLILGTAMYVNLTPHNLLLKLPLLAQAVMTALQHGTLSLMTLRGQLLLSTNLIISRTLIVFCVLVALYFLFDFQKTKKLGSLLSLAVTLGVSMYVQLHGAITMTIAVAFVLAWLWWKNELTFARGALFGIIFVIIAFPYVLYTQLVSPQYHDLLYWAFNVYFGHAFAIPPFLSIVIMIIFVAMLWWLAPTLRPLSLGLFVSAFVGTNLHVVLGSNPVMSNWWEMAYTILAALVLCVGYRAFPVHWHRRMMSCALGVLVLIAGLQSVVTYAQGAQDSYFDPALKDMLKQVAALPDDAVVAAPPDITSLVTLYAQKRVYLCEYYQTSAPFEENAQRYIDTQWLFNEQQNVTRSDATPFVRTAAKKNSWRASMTTEVYAPAIVDELVASGKEYRARAERVRASDAPGLAYRADYVVRRTGAPIACDATVTYANERYELLKLLC